MQRKIDFNKLYDPLSLEYILITTSEEFLEQALAGMTEESTQDLVRKGTFRQEWRLNREFLLGKKGGE